MSQYFKIKLLGITGGEHSVVTRNLLFLKGHAELTSYSNFQEIDATRHYVQHYDLYLGNLNDRDYLDIEILLDEIPLSPFTLFCDLPCEFSATFQIELLEE